MPNRLLREGILRSDRVDKLFPEEELFYRRLMSVVDDFGRYEARPRILRCDCYPTKDENYVTEEDIKNYLMACNRAGLIKLYTVNGKEYLQIEDFNQRLRTKTIKHPAPDDSEFTEGPSEDPEPQLDEEPDSEEFQLTNEDQPEKPDNSNQAEELYALYTKKVEKPESLKEIQKAIKKIGFDALKQHVIRYAKLCEGKEKQFIPSPRRWFRNERWNDEVVKSNEALTDDEVIEKEWAKIRKNPQTDLTPEQRADLYGYKIDETPPDPSELTEWPDQQKKKADENGPNGPDAVPPK